jgi:hypothetical protein
MALKLSNDLKNYIINQGIIKQMAGTAGTGGTCEIKIYSGTQPTNADTEPTGTSGTVLCQIIGIGWGGSNGTVGATCGTAAFGTAAGYTGTGAITGTAGWARMRTYGTNFLGSAGTYTIDGNVGTASTCDFVINSVSIVATGAVSLLTAPIAIA